jgi:hypothetical protein
MNGRIKMEGYSSKIVKTWEGDGYQVEFTIGHQTFRLQEMRDDDEITPKEYTKWYKKQLDAAFENLRQIWQPGTTKVKELPGVINDALESITVTECCEIGPITRENYCPTCGKKIIRQTTQRKKIKQ